MAKSKYSNKMLEKFVLITLGNNLDKSFKLKGISVLSLIKKILNFERELILSDVRKLLNSEIENSSNESFMSQWQGKEIEEQLLHKLKEKILVEIDDKLRKLYK